MFGHRGMNGRRGWYICVLACVIVLLVRGVSMSAEPTKMQVWPADALEKVFQDAKPPDKPADKISLEAARGETVSAQAVARSDEVHMVLRGSCTVLKREGGARIPPPQVRCAAYVPVRENTPGTPPEHLVRKAPADFPDPLLEGHAYVLRGTAQPIWLTIRVPAEAPAGKYVGTLTFHAHYAGQAELPVEVTVHDVLLPAERTLKVTNWFSLGAIATYHGCAMWSDRYWELLEAYARNMADHRQNVALTSLRELIDFKPGPDGKLTFGWERFDRYVKLFTKAGVVGYVEGSHLGHREGGDWGAKRFVIWTYRVADGKVAAGSAVAGSDEAKQFLQQFLPALQDHLAERGWLDVYFQHLCDEPIDANADSYNTLLADVRRFGPKLKTIDANMCEKIDGLSVWVPILNIWHKQYAFYQQRQREHNEEVWFYTCLGPTGTYANRLIDYSLLKVRLLHWLNFHYGATGYLHWGYNHWAVPVPMMDVERVHNPTRCLPPGDAGIIYPGPSGPLDSIRFEAMRDGIEDYELLKLLAKKDADAARKISESIIFDFDRYESDGSSFRAARRRLLQALASK